ncbi:hypothetical protein ABEB36_005408 [Hypothenemus hampei]|uniref:Uncharacterized protein n=1 Tax=Hypothenemus hampei TaxID=57062 RepID=A0ABD1EY45_HYPHA
MPNSLTLSSTEKANLIKKALRLLHDINTMDDHILSQTIMDNHKIQLIKIIIGYYIDVRLFHESKQKSEKTKNIRQKFTKLILFHNQ